MVRIVLSGWNEGMKKVSLTKSIKLYTDTTLADAKSMTDRILNNEEVNIQVPREDAYQALNEFISLGVLATIME